MDADQILQWKADYDASAAATARVYRDRHVAVMTARGWVPFGEGGWVRALPVPAPGFPLDDIPVVPGPRLPADGAVA